jgi:hypothetical protein
VATDLGLLNDEAAGLYTTYDPQNGQRPAS